jgi:hypothetical protein
LAGVWRRWWGASEGRRNTKLFTTSEIENVGISGELRSLVRAGGEIDLRGPSCGIPRADDEELFLVRRRVCRLELRANACIGTGGGGGEVPTIEENEERDE